MKRLLLALLALTASGIFFAAPAMAGPSMEVPRKIIRLNTPALKGVPIIGTFPIKNSGDQPLEIKKVRVG